MSLELLEKLVQYVSIGKWNKLFFFLLLFICFLYHYYALYAHSQKFIYVIHQHDWAGDGVVVCACACVPFFFFFFFWGGGGGVTYWSGRSVNSAYELFNLRAQKISTLYKNYIFQCTGNICMWNLKGTLWNSTKHILPIYSEFFFYFASKNLRALRFKTSQVFLKRCPDQYSLVSVIYVWLLHYYWQHLFRYDGKCP